MNKQTRGERNNNPGNIDRSNIKWQGMSTDQPDSRFITFGTPEDGIRALAKVLLTYYRKHGLDTVHGIVSRWAPSVENDTSSYVNYVADALGVTPDDQINVENPDMLVRLVKAIIHHENGRVIYSDATIEDGIDRALA